MPFSDGHTRQPASPKHTYFPTLVPKYPFNYKYCAPLLSPIQAFLAPYIFSSAQLAVYALA